MKLFEVKNRRTPHGNYIVWRYMSLRNFKYLMKNEALFFTAARNLADKYEFTVPKKTLEKLGEECDSNELEQKLRHLSEYRNSTFVNCWTRKQHESYLLWKIYLRGSHNGVAIKSTASKLGLSLESRNKSKNFKMYFVDVKYDDYIPPDQLGLPTIAATKRRFYKGEDEVRLFFSVDKFFELEPNVDGIPIDIDPDMAIDAVYLSPFGNDRVLNEFTLEMQNLYPSLVGKIKQSEILDE